MKYFKITTVFLLFLSLNACFGPKKINMTPLEIQSIQTREYNSSKDIVFPSVMSLFQDLGYTITNADKETGLISAESTSESNKLFKIFFGRTRVKQTKATGYVERIGNITTVRISFVEILNSSSGWGQEDREDTQILDIEIYQNAFERVENAIFIRESNSN